MSDGEVGSTPRVRRSALVVAAVCAVGLVLTLLASWASARADRATEQRLLQTQTRQAAAVLSTAILNIQQPMLTALQVQRVVDRADRSKAFTRALGGQVGKSRMFTSASLWRRGPDGMTPAATLGMPPGLDPSGPAIQALLRHALSTGTSVVRRVEVGRQPRIAYALADPTTGLVVYAERAIPANRRAPVDRDSAYADLNYAIYLGTDTRTADMTTTDVAPGALPLTGRTAQASVPFGDTVLTLVTTPRHHLGSSLGRWLWWILLLGGAALTIATAVVTTRLFRSRQRAEEDTRTITDLYERVDTLYGEQRALFMRLQRALLPRLSPRIAGLEVAAEYVAGTQGVDIGGDWYSVVAVDEDRFAFVVGDVSGHGLDAVAEMAHARFTVRAYLVQGDQPHEALDKCSHQFDVVEDGHIVTILVGVGDRRTGEVTVANAGHPPPLLLSDSCSPEFVPMPVGPPLGAGPYAYESVTFHLPVGATLLGYTDGLVERRGEDIAVGMRRLREAVVHVAGERLTRLVADVLATLRDEHANDDIAVLALRRIDS